MESSFMQHCHDAPESRPGIEVDLSALVASLDDAGRGEGLTTAEVAERLGCNQEKARQAIKQAIGAGKCRPSNKTAKNMAGRWQVYPSYVFGEQAGG